MLLSSNPALKNNDFENAYKRTSLSHFAETLYSELLACFQDNEINFNFWQKQKPTVSWKHSVTREYSADASLKPSCLLWILNSASPLKNYAMSHEPICTYLSSQQHKWVQKVVIFNTRMYAKCIAAFQAVTVKLQRLYSQYETLNIRLKTQ